MTAARRYNPHALYVRNYEQAISEALDRIRRARAGMRAPGASLWYEGHAERQIKRDQHRLVMLRRSLRALREASRAWVIEQQAAAITALREADGQCEGRR